MHYAYIFYLTAYAVKCFFLLLLLFLHVPNAFIQCLSYFSNLRIEYLFFFFFAVADGRIVLLDPPETTQSVTIVSDAF